MCQKNPAYGRHRISQLMRTVAPTEQDGLRIQKKTKTKQKTEKIIQNGKTQQCLEICQN